MEKFQLTNFLTIEGIGSASGIVYTDHSLFIISDNSSYLYQYHLEHKHLSKIALVENSQDNMAKKIKYDLEAITFHHNKLHLFGSGSTENRNSKFVYDISSNTVVKENLKKNYQKIKTTLSIDDNELNIEGALFIKDILYLFQRGNGANSKNGIVILEEIIRFIPIVLPKINHVEATFTDAIVLDDKIFFLASAEDTTSTYDDGEVLGSLIGCLDMDTFAIDFAIPISTTHKFEGLTFYEKTNSHLSFLLCEDNDTEDLVSNIYKLKIKF